MSQTKEQLRKIVDSLSISTAPYADADNLLEKSILDSMSFLSLIASIESEFEILMDIAELDPETITTVDGLEAQVLKFKKVSS